jgi:hypothetical protein
MCSLDICFCFSSFRSSNSLFVFLFLLFSSLLSPNLVLSQHIPAIEKEIAETTLPSDPGDARKALKSILDKYQSLTEKHTQTSILEANSEKIK